MKKYTVKQPKVSILKKYMALQRKAMGEYCDKLLDLERLMAKETGISDIEFFMSDGHVCGICNASRTMKLWQE